MIFASDIQPDDSLTFWFEEAVPEKWYLSNKIFDALACAQRTLDRGLDTETDQSCRAFFYLPFMHSEDLPIQDECVRLCDACLDSSDNLHHAKERWKVIRRFGCFPHRNHILGRESTPAEVTFLENGGCTPP